MSDVDLLRIRPPAWMERAACIGREPDLFFGTETGPGKAAAAKRICASCPVVAECRAFADAEGLLGVWGGTTTKERRAAARGGGSP